MNAKKLKPMTGLRFGRLVVTGRAESPHSAAVWFCDCECGAQKIVDGRHLRSGAIRSCGCLRAEVTGATRVRHGHARQAGTSSVYGIWCAMRQRCESETHKDYSSYGGRGIKVCARWASFENFLADMGCPGPGMTIERQQVNGNYEPGNCQWATRLEQSNNTRSNVVVKVGDARMTMAQFVRMNGLQYSATRLQIKRGLRCIAGHSIEVTYPEARS